MLKGARQLIDAGQTKFLWNSPRGEIAVVGLACSRRSDSSGKLNSASRSVCDPTTYSSPSLTAAAGHYRSLALFRHSSRGTSSRRSFHQRLELRTSVVKTTRESPRLHHLSDLVTLAIP